LIQEKFGLEIPKEDLLSKWEFWREKRIREAIHLDYPGKIHSLSLNMGIKGSLSMYAQLVRQRQILCDIEPLEQITRGGRFVVPPSFLEDVKKEYRKIAIEAKKKTNRVDRKSRPKLCLFPFTGTRGQIDDLWKGLGNC